MIYKTSAIVIQAIDYGETHRIITVINEHGAIVPIMARGAKKVPSKFTAVAQPFVHAEFVYARNHGMGNLQHADVIQSFPRLRADLLATAVAASVNEMVTRLVNEENTSAAIYRLVLSLWEQLDLEKDPLALSAIMESKMLGVAGYAPQCSQCVRCGVTPAKEQDFTHVLIREGGAVCTSCLRLGQAVPISRRGLHWLRVFPQVQIQQLGNLSLKPESVAEVRKILRLFWEQHIGGEWKSRNVLDQLTESSTICYIPSKVNRKDQEE